MDDFWHDSPTFLNRKDGFIMGLTIAQMLLVAGLGVLWGLVGMSLEGVGLSSSLAWLIAGSGLGVTLAAILVKISGLRLAHYCVLLFLRWRSRPQYWIEGGALHWDEVEEREGSDRFGMGRLAGGLTAEQGEEVRIAGHGLHRWARDSYGSVRDYLRYTVSMLLKGNSSRGA